ncbi:MAG: hypothetical protein PVI57_01685 [Gemmatimonadota bacterium]
MSPLVRSVGGASEVARGGARGGARPRPSAGGVAPGERPLVERVIALLCTGLAVVGLGAWAFERLWRGGFEAGSWVGMALGFGAAGALLAVMAYSVRRSMPSVRALGKTRPYLRLHLWAGGLFAVLFLAHTGFRAPSGLLMDVLWIVSLWVVITGVVGMLLQRWIPRVLDDTSSLEVHLHRIPELVEGLRERAETTARGAGPAVRAFYEREMSEEMERVRTALRVRPGRTVAQTFRSSEYEIVRGTLDAEGAAALDALRELHRAKVDLDQHHTLQVLLRTWLFLHLPAGVLLLALVALHVFFVFYF